MRKHRSPWRTWKELDPVLDDRATRKLGRLTWTRRAALLLELHCRWHILTGGCPGCDRKRKGPHRFGCSIGGKRQLQFSVHDPSL